VTVKHKNQSECPSGSEGARGSLFSFVGESGYVIIR
jgi:hypothetical protein